MKTTLISALAAMWIGLTPSAQAAGIDVGAPLPAAMAAKGKLIVGTYCSYPPFGFAGSDGVPKGLDPDIGHELANIAFGDRDAIEFQCVRSDQRISFLQSGRVDILLTTLGVTIERAKVVSFSEPYFASSTVFLTRAGEDFATFDDLKDQQVGVSSGTPWITWLQRCKPDLSIVQFDSIPTQVEALAGERVRALMVDSTLGYPLAEQSKAFAVSGPSVDAQGYQWAIGARKGESELVAWLNASIKEMQSKDLFWTILTKYVTSDVTLKGMTAAVRRPGQTPDYSVFLASVEAEPSCPK